MNKIPLATVGIAEPGVLEWEKIGFPAIVWLTTSRPTPGALWKVTLRE